MSLLMQALKKAEEANKNKPQPAMSPNIVLPASEPGEGLALAQEPAQSGTHFGSDTAMPNAFASDAFSAFPSLAMAYDEPAREQGEGGARIQADAISGREPRMDPAVETLPAKADEARPVLALEDAPREVSEPSIQLSPTIALETLAPADSGPASKEVRTEVHAPTQPEPYRPPQEEPRDLGAQAYRQEKPAPQPEQSRYSAYTAAATSSATPAAGDAPKQTQASVGAEAADRQKARMVFSAKHAGPSRNRYLIPAGVGIVGVLLAGAYLYWQMQPSHPALSLPSAQIAEPAAIEPAAIVILEQESGVQADGAATPSAADPVTTAAATLAATTPAAPAARRVETGVQQTLPARPSVAETRPAPEPLPPTQSAQEAQSSSPRAGAEAIRIRPGTAAPSAIHTSLQRAYSAFHGGDLALARQEYRNVLRQDPANRDGLLGSALIALREQSPDQAAALFGRMLELDPSDPDAIAGLAALQPGDPSRDESRLKQTITQQPNSASAWFALGNLYARQSRWSEAQQAFFRAFGMAPANADFAYSLAVSLDQLGQGRLALDYYQHALGLAQDGRAGFDRAQVQERIGTLKNVVQ